MNRAIGLAADYAYVARARLRAVRYGVRPPAPNAGWRHPVLMIPGVFETWHYLRPLGQRLAALGHPVHYVAALGFNHRPIGATAAMLQRYLQREDLREVMIVAHSKGGLVGKRMLAHDDLGDARVTRLVAVNSPFSGTTVARLGLGPWREFLPTNQRIVALARELAVNSRIVSLTSQFDQYIPGGVHLDGAENVVLPDVGHFAVLGRPKAIDEIVSHLEERRAREH
jgi:pimeloyl-ACP methyl ester carboxylesterase